MLKIITNQNSVVINQLQNNVIITTEIFQRNELTFRITNPDILVLYKIEDPNIIYLQDKFENITINETTLTTANYESLISGIFQSGGNSGGITKEEVKAMLSEYLIKNSKTNQEDVDILVNSFVINGRELVINLRDYAIKGTAPEDFKNTNPIYGDLTFLTDDGTKDSTLQKVYMWNGFDWNEVSSNYNLFFTVIPGYDISNYIDPIPTRYTYNTSTGQLKALINLDIPTFINKVIELQQINEKDYNNFTVVFRGIKDYNYNNFFKEGTTTVMIQNYELAGSLDPNQYPNLILKDNKLSNIDLGSAYLKDVNLENLELTQSASIYLPDNIQGNVTLNNIKSADENLYISMDSILRKTNNPFYIEINNVSLDSFRFNITSESGEKVDTYMNFKNIKFPHSFSSFDLTGVNLKQINLDSSFDFSDILYVNFNDISFESQEQLDILMQFMLDNGLGVYNIDKSPIDLTSQALEMLVAGTGFNKSTGKPEIDEEQDSIFTYKLPAAYNKYFIEGLTTPTVRKLTNVSLVKMFNVLKPSTNTNPSQTFQYELPSDGKFSFTPNNSNNLYLGITLANRSESLTYDWTSTFKLYDYSPLKNIQISFYGCNYTPSQSIIDKFNSRYILLNIM